MKNNHQKAEKQKRLKHYDELIKKILKNKKKCYDPGWTVRYAHAFIKQLWSYYNNRSWPTKMHALHHCDNGYCINLFHIYPGTHTNNMRDMIRRNRRDTVNGEAHPISKLTKKDIIFIRKVYDLNKRNGEKLARLFNVSRTLIHSVLKRKTWKHIK